MIVGHTAVQPPVWEPPPKKVEEKVLLLPQASRCATHAVSYLSGRGIDSELIDFCISTGRLYESSGRYHNIVFVGHDSDGKARYANLRGIVSDFKGEANGSDKRFSFNIPAENSRILHMFESAIDLLSFATIRKRNGIDWRKDYLLSLAGVYPPKEKIEESAVPLALTQYCSVDATEPTTQITSRESARINPLNGSRRTIKIADSGRMVAGRSAKGTVKTAQRTVRTAERTAHATVKTSQTTAMTAQKSAMAAAKASHWTAQAARAAAIKTAEGAKATAKATVSAVRAIIAGTKALITALFAGGWIAATVILLVVLLGCAISLFGGGSGSNQAIVEVALTQLGNEDGEPYWSWYGLNDRVEWCACFVSWCADQCGYIDSGIIPKFSGCVEGVSWFQSNGQWQDRSYEPQAGNIIFFDWADENGQDGSADHVESCKRRRTESSIRSRAIPAMPAGRSNALWVTTKSLDTVSRSIKISRFGG